MRPGRAMCCAAHAPRIAKLLKIVPTSRLLKIVKGRWCLGPGFNSIGRNISAGARKRDEAADGALSSKYTAGIVLPAYMPPGASNAGPAHRTDVGTGTAVKGHWVGSDDMCNHLFVMSFRGIEGLMDDSQT